MLTRSRILSHVALLGSVPLLANANAAPARQALVNQSLKASEVSALQARAQRMGEFAEINGAENVYEPRGTGHVNNASCIPSDPLIDFTPR